MNKNIKLFLFLKKKIWNEESSNTFHFWGEKIQKLYMHMKLFCSSPSQRRQILINPFSEKDIKSSSNPWAAVHIEYGIFLHVHNHRKHYFLLKQIVLQSFERFECRNIFLFLHLISHWFDTCGCITIIIFPSNFLSVPKIKPKELFNNFGLFKSSGNLALSSRRNKCLPHWFLVCF